MTALPLTAQTKQDYVSYTVPGMTTPLNANGVTVITDTNYSTVFASALTSGWYLFEKTFSYSGTITISGDVNLILADGCNVTVTGTGTGAGIDVEGTNSLTIYAQSAGTGTLTATGAGGGAGIGGSGGATGASGGTITINGGTINANGSISSEGGGAGIGGGGATASGNNGGDGGIIIINGGTIKAYGGTEGNSGGGAGIGGGGGGKIGGGGGAITICGGSITASGGDGHGGGAGIGGGGCDHNISGSAGGDAGTINILIDVNTITVKGGSGSNAYGANIGPGGSQGSGNVAYAGTNYYTTPASGTHHTVTITQPIMGGVSVGTITAIPNGETDQVDFIEGASQTFVIVPEAGYVLTEVRVDDTLVSTSSPYVLTNVTSNCTISATFAQKSVTVGTQTTPLTFGGTTSATFPVTTVGTFTYTTVDVNGLPTGASASVNSGTLTITRTATTPAGTYKLALTIDGIVSNQFDFTIKVAQQAALSITGLDDSYTCGDAPFTIGVTGGSGTGAVTFTSSDPSVASVSGTTVSILQAGTFKITATKAGNGNYAEASVTSGTVTVGQGMTGISLSAAGGTYTNNTLTLTATVSKVGSGVTPTGTVTFKEGDTELATKSLNRYGMATCTLASPIAPGSYTFTAEYSGDTNYYGAVSDSCTTDVEPFLSVSPASLHFDASGGTLPIAIVCTSGWSIDCNEQWLTSSVVESQSTDMNIVMNVTAEANPTAAPRTALITVSLPGIIIKTVSVTQDAGVNPITALQTTGISSVRVYSQAGNVYVQSDAPIRRVAVYDVSGRLLKTVQGGTQSIEISDLPKQQVLIVQVTGDEGQTSYKLRIEN